MGAGDGRIVVKAAKQFHAAAVGVEIDPIRCALANLWIRILGLPGRTRVRWGNMHWFPADADVVMLYLLQGTNRKLKDRLER